jgi:hypothetical protein
MECLEYSRQKYTRKITMKRMQNTYQNWSCDYGFEKNFVNKIGEL